jgi:hypothetical protein
MDIHLAPFIWMVEKWGASTLFVPLHFLLLTTLADHHIVSLWFAWRTYTIYGWAEGLLFSHCFCQDVLWVELTMEWISSFTTSSGDTFLHQTGKKVFFL